jgi:hypothetical protein
MSSRKINLAINIPEKEFFDWVKQFAPEVSPDAELVAIIPVPDNHEIVVRVHSDKEHTLSYLKKNAKPKGVSK